MEINIYNNYQGIISFPYEKIIKEIAEYLQLDCSLSIILVDNQAIKQLNNEYRSIDKETDVLSFPDGEEEYLGDIFVSIDKTISQAQEYNHNYEREFAFLVTHGVLHLLGYDHDTKDNELEMIEKQNEILNRLAYWRN